MCLGQEVASIFSLRPSAADYLVHMTLEYQLTGEYREISCKDTICYVPQTRMATVCSKLASDCNGNAVILKVCMDAEYCIGRQERFSRILDV